MRTGEIWIRSGGLLREYWYHGAGCHGWLVVERDTRTHRIIAASMARAEPSR